MNAFTSPFHCPGVPLSERHIVHECEPNKLRGWSDTDCTSGDFRLISTGSLSVRSVPQLIRTILPRTQVHTNLV